jgi:hypothetical protein
MAAISHGYALPAIALAVSLLVGLACVACAGEVACLFASLPLAFSAYWMLSTVVLGTELPKAVYAQIQQGDPHYRQILSTRMRGGQLTYGDLYAARAQYEGELGERARRSMANDGTSAGRPAATLASR